MKKSNKQRQALLQRKRTKRNQSRKGVKYNPEKVKIMIKTPQIDSETISL